MPIAVLLTMTARPGQEAELQRRFTQVMEDVRTEPGNLLVVTMRDPETPSKLYEFAIYKDQAAIEAHAVADHALKKGPWVRELFSEPRTPWFFDTVDWPETQKIG